MAEPTQTGAYGGRAPLLAGRYELLRTQETDANTASVLAFDQRLKRWRSIRVARPGDDAAADRLVALAQRAAQLEHPNLERVLDVGRDGPVAFVVRDRFVGSVAQHVGKRGGVAPGWAVRVVARCAEGLAWAHPRGIIHGHPRPDVVLFAEDGEAILTRFGQRALLRDDDETRAGAPWAHLAPELRQYWEPDVATDIFALGSLLYTLLAGHHSADLFYAEAYEGLLAPVPRPLRSVVIQACAFEPRERYASAAELQDTLLSKLKSLPSVQEPAPWLEVTQDFPERGEVDASDAIIDELARALGFPPPSAVARRVDDRSNHSTLDPQTPPPAPTAYAMPNGAVDGSGMVGSPMATPPPAPQYAAPPPAPAPPLESPSHPAAYDIVPGQDDLFAPDVPDYIDASVASQSSTPAHISERGRPPVGAPSPAVRRRYEEDEAEGVPLGLVLRWIVVAGLFATTFVAVAGGVAWFFAGRETRANDSFVESVLAEEPSFGSWITEDPQLRTMWTEFHDAPDDMKASAASDFVRRAVERADGAPDMVPVEVSLALERLSDAREDWQATR